MRLLSVSIEAELGLSVVVQLQIRVPIKGSAIVFHIRQRLVRIVGLIEFLGSGIAWKNISAVARGNSMRVELVDKVIIY